VAALATGLVVWLTAPDDAAGDERRAMLIPVIDDHSAGLVLDGRW
jgi:hypothetical protein